MSPPPPFPRKSLDPLRLLLMQSGTRLLFNTCDKTIITILNFKISGEGKLWLGGGGEFQPLPRHLYETLDLKQPISWAEEGCMGILGIVNNLCNVWRVYC